MEPRGIVHRQDPHSSPQHAARRNLPIDTDFVVFLQEVIMEPGKAQSEKDDIQLTAGKQAEEWRGTAIAHNSGIVHSQTKLLRCGISCLPQWSGQRIVGVAGHLPHHATMVQTGGILDSWSAQIRDKHLGILGWDANETFTAAEPDNNLASHSARGEYPQLDPGTPPTSPQPATSTSNALPL